MPSSATIPLSDRALCSLEDVALHRDITVGAANENKDQILTQIINTVSAEIERQCDRRFKRGVHTEYFNGTRWRTSVPLRAIPVVSITNIWDDLNLDYNTAVNSENYTFNPDNGMIYLLGGSFSSGYRNIKVTYTGGQALFIVQEGINDQIRVNDDGSTWATATIPPPDFGMSYTAEDLADAIETAVNALSDFDDTLTVTYSSTTRKFTFASDGSTFQIMADTGGSGWDDRMEKFGALIGMTTGASSGNNKTGATSYVMDTLVGNVSEDLRWAAAEWAVFMYNQTIPGGDRFGVSGTGGDGPGSAQFFLRNPPTYTKQVLASYKRTWL